MEDKGARPKEQRGEKKVYCGHRKTTITDIKHPYKQVSRTDEAIGHLSVRLDEVLDKVGASGECRKIRQDCAISREIIQTLCHQVDRRLCSFYIFGSSSEGTTTLGINSDTDVLLYYDNYPVIDNIGDTGDRLSFLMIRDEHTQPGYVKLQVVYNGQHQTVNTLGLDSVEFDSEGRLCLKHVSILGEVKAVDERNGPADTYIKENVDHVIGLRCSKIPEFAREWIGRKRRYKWPPKCMVDKMATMGCFVVGVGHPASIEKNIEWRLSFSLQERLMMFSMNLVQHKCYIMLKMIKKYFFEPIVGKSVSSYHLKTCMLHTMENTKSAIGKRNNLFQCVLLCLCVLLKWVYTGYCPNYFIKEENMFDRDLHRTQKLNLIRKINAILSSGCDFLFTIKLDKIGDLLKQKHTRNVKIESESNKTILEQKHNLLDSMLFFSVALCIASNTNISSTLFINMVLTYLSQTKSIKDHTEQQTQKAFSYILPIVHLQLAQSFASLAFNTPNNETNQTLLQGVGRHLRKGRHYDLMTSVLFEATVFYKLEQYECCIVILNQLESILNQEPLSICSCYQSKPYYTENHVIQLSSLSVPSILSRITTCVKFMRSDMSIIPDALQYEIFRSINTPLGSRDKYLDNWFDLAVVDAVVYVHFMQYLVNAKLNRSINKHVAIDKLGSALQRERNLGHRDTGYNLLGCIYEETNQIQKAIECFCKSWHIRPVHNAAKWHLCNALYKYKIPHIYSN